MEFTAKQIADFVQGTIEGNDETTVSRFSKIEEAEQGSLTFLSNPKYANYIYTTGASIVLVNKDFTPTKTIIPTLIKVQNPYEALAKLMNLYDQYKPKPKGIDENCYISQTATIGQNCYVGTFAYIGNKSTIGNNSLVYPQTYIGNNVSIGENCILYPGVKIYDDCIIGNNCILHSGVVIGSDGFGFAPTKDGYDKIPQIGNVILEDNIEIGANTTVDRATMGSTILRKGVKLDNLIQIAHNVEIGKNTVIAALAGVAGSAKVGENCMIGGQVGIAGHTVVGNNVKAQAQTGIASSVKDNIALYGSPALEFREFQKSYVHFKHLPQLVNRLEELERKISLLSGESET